MILRGRIAQNSRGGIVSLFLITLLFASGVGCASTHSLIDSSDPFESMNRSFHMFNKTLDRFVMQPVVDVYKVALNDDLRLSVSNFYDNLSYPNVVLNDFLQGKVKQGLSDTGRFLVNTTLGVGGLFDAGTVFGLEKHNEDLGQTLAVWGLTQGPYLEVPFVGPTTAREVTDLGGSGLTNVFSWIQLPVLVAGFTYAAPLVILGIIDQRARVDNDLRARDELALDTYLFTREAYLQRRNFLIYDGSPPTEEMYAALDAFEKEILELEENPKSTDTPSSKQE